MRWSGLERLGVGSDCSSRAATMCGDPVVLCRSEGAEFSPNMSHSPLTPP